MRNALLNTAANGWIATRLLASTSRVNAGLSCAAARGVGFLYSQPGAAYCRASLPSNWPSPPFRGQYRPSYRLLLLSGSLGNR